MPRYEINEIYRLEAEANQGCALYQSDSDNDGITDDVDACPNTFIGADIYPSGCKIESESEPTDNEDTIFGMEPMIFYAAAGGGGLLFLGLVFIIISRMRGSDFDFDDDDDDDWFDDDDDDEEDDFMSSILGNRAVLEEVQPPGHSEVHNEGHRVQVHKGALLAEALQGLRHNEVQAEDRRRLASKGPPSGPTRGPPGGQLEAHPVRDLLEDPTQRGPQRGGASLGAATVGKKVAKRKPVSGDGRVRKAKVQIDPDLFDKDELADRAAANRLD